MKILFLANVGSLEKKSNHAAKILRTKNEKSNKGLFTWRGGPQVGEVTGFGG